MKKIITVLMGLLVLMMPAVLAEGLEPEVGAGITPDMIFYKLDVWWDEVRIRNADTVVEQARLRLEVAEERLSEMKKMAEQNKLRAMEEAIGQHRNQLTNIERNVEELGTDELKNQIQERLQKHNNVLESVMENAPEQAQEGLNKALQSSSAVFENNQLQISIQNRLNEYEIQNKISMGDVQIKGKINENLQ